MDGTDGTDGMYPRPLLRLQHLAVLKNVFVGHCQCPKGRLTRAQMFWSFQAPSGALIVHHYIFGARFLRPPPQSIARGLFQLPRRDREFLPFSLMLRDEIENFFLLISCFETRTRISFINLRHRDENENRDWDNSRENFRELHLLLVY